MFEPAPAVLETGQTLAAPDGKTRSLQGSIALDQWRGLALILVLISHGFFFTNRVNGAGRIGVNLFFFISGILVFRSLAKESGGPWGVTTSFWWRRLRRLYPALLAYLVAMLGATIFLQRLPNLPPGSDLRSYLQSLAWAVTYLINYRPDAPMSLGHLWSLSCEMQFYLLAPAIFLLGGRTMTRRSVVFGGLTIALVSLGLLYPLRSPHYEAAKYHFEIAVWPMMLGFFCEFAKKWFLRLPLGLVRAIFAAGVIALIASLIVMPFGMGMKKLVIGVGGILLFPCLLGYLFGLPIPGKTGAFLRWMGERTYSIYLWQEPLTLCNFLPPILHPVGAAVSVLAGAGWFALFEKPFLSANRSHRPGVAEAGVK